MENETDIDTHPTPTPWRTAELIEELDKLSGSGLAKAKKVGTVLAILEMEAAGKGYDTPEFWKREDTCARSTYYKWRQWDEDFVPTLERVRNLLRKQRTETAVSAVSEAFLKIQEASPKIADRLIKIATKGQNDWAAMQAGFGLLDRATPQSGGKGEGEKKASSDNSGLTADTLAKLNQVADRELAEWEAANK